VVWLMRKILTIVLLVALAGLIWYNNFGSPVIKARGVVDSGIDNAKQAMDLSPEQEQLLRVQFAILDYQRINGLPPVDLSDLVPTYFDTVPKDPITEEIYSYERVGADYQLGSEVGQIQPMDIVKDVFLTLGQEYINPNTMEEDAFVYSFVGKRDPFVQFNLSPKVQVAGNGTPLEQYNLAQLRLAAILSDPTGGERLAIVEDVAGKGYTVRKGTKIGNRAGYVVSIEADVVKILETSVDFAGNETQNVVELKVIRKPQ
jgi:Tfp pilus assembly protein PilP